MCSYVLKEKKVTYQLITFLQSSSWIYYSAFLGVIDPKLIFSYLTSLFKKRRETAFWKENFYDAVDDFFKDIKKFKLLNVQS